jgi:hypothetical protein
MRLQIGHEECGGDSLSGNVADDEAQAVRTEREEVVVIAADVPSLRTEAGIFEGSGRRETLREEPGLYLPCDIQFVSEAALEFKLFRIGAALGLNRLVYFVKTYKRKGIPVDVFEAGEYLAPDGALLAVAKLRIFRVRLVQVALVLDAPEARRMAKANTAVAPFTKFSGDIFSDKDDVGGASDELVIRRVRLGLNQREHGGAIGRRDGDPALAGVQTGVKREVESKLIEIEAQAAFLIADEHVNRMKLQVGVLPVLPGAISRALMIMRVGHSADYRSKLGLFQGSQDDRFTGMAIPIAYTEEIRARDTEKALETVQAKLFPNEERPWAIDFSGTCPRCGDPIEIRQWIVVVAGALKLNDAQRQAMAAHLDQLGIDRSQGDETFDLTCTCEAAHPQRPKDKHGCGARFRVHVTWP